MGVSKHVTGILAAGLIAIAGLAGNAVADDAFQLHAPPPGKGPGNGGRGGGGGNDNSGPTFYNWMHSDVQGTWDGNYLGQNVAITVVDDFSSRSRFFGILEGRLKRRRHGEWTSLMASLIAPSADMYADDFNAAGAVTLQFGVFNVLNLSYGALYAPGAFVSYDAQEASIINFASSNQAFVAKSAGNDGVAIGSAIPAGTYAGWYDQLAIGLTGAGGAIFVDALSGNGTAGSSADLAYYSNYPGASTVVQDQFLVVGVDSASTGLAGTSFAAPIVAGYAAIISSKFTTADVSAVADQLLGTARYDYLVSSDKSRFGMGEACLSCALSPIAIN